jgi:enoyl-[acyl-carrier protein] reductase I
VPGLLDGKNVLVTGVITDQSIAFAVARLAQEQGANVILTGYGRLSLVRRIAKRLPMEAPVIELDVTAPEHLERLAAEIGEHVTCLDAVVHSVAFAPEGCFGDNFLHTTWADAAVALQVSCFSLKSLTMACLPLMRDGGSVVGLDFDASVAWPAYGWMGVAKAGLESTARYLARELGGRGVRVNLVAAGPLRTTAAKAIPAFEQFEQAWQKRSPLGWKLDDPGPAAQACVALMSSWFPATTGEIIHVDGGFHAVGA